MSLRERVRSVLVPVFKPSRSTLLPGIGASLLMRPLPFEAWFRLRAWWFLATGRRLDSLHEAAPQTEGFIGRVAGYNQSKLWEFFRSRTEKFMAILRCIDAVPRDARILVIGPRNEAEILLLSLYGYKLTNITGIDLFSYSPRIQCMDMHALAFPDNSFDVVYSAWTLRYSYDLERACREIVRVAKPGGVVATGFSDTKIMSDVTGAAINGGLTELLGAFEPNVGWIYWQEITPVPGAEDVTVVFRVKK